MYKLLVSSVVKRDLRKTYLWYEKEQEGLGERFLEEFESMAANLQSNPLNFPVVFQDKRRQVFPTFPYCNYFKISGKTIREFGRKGGKKETK